MRHPLSRNRTPSRCRRLACPLLECLEDRTLLSGQSVDLGALRFCADQFTQNGNAYSANGTIQIGLAPTGSETFQPLVELLGSVSFTTGTANPVFTADGTLASVVQTSPERIDLGQWNGTVAVGDLLGNGAAVTNAATVPIEGINFAATDLAFADPDGGTTSNAQLQLHGNLNLFQLVGLDVPVAGGDHVTIDTTGPQLPDLNESVTESFTLFGAAIVPTSLTAIYTSSQGVFGLVGSATFATADGAIRPTQVQFGTTADPGLLAQTGQVTQLQLTLPSDLELWKLQFTATDLTFQYDLQQNQFEIYGCTALDESYPLQFGGALGDSSAPGITISGLTGDVVGFDLDVQNSVSFAGIPIFSVQDVNFQYDLMKGQYELSGILSVPELFGATANLGTTSQPAIVFKDGSFQIDNLAVSIEDVYLGFLLLDQLTVILNPPGSQGGWEVDGRIWLPLGMVFQAEFGFDGEGHLNTLGITAKGLNVEIGDTGLVLKGIQAEVQNFAHPSDIVLTGGLTVAWGQVLEDFPLPTPPGGDADLSLFGASGSFTVDKDHLVLMADFFVVFWLDPVTGNVEGLYGEGQAEVDINWGNHDYGASLDVQIYDDLFSVSGSLNISSNGSIFFLAQADVNVPDHIPFIGGDTLFSIDFALSYQRGKPKSDDFVAAWTTVDLFFFDVDIGFKVDFDGHFSVIGHHQIDSIKNGSSSQPQSYQYYGSFVVPDGAASGLLQVEWPDEGGTQTVAIVPPGQTTPIDQSQFSAGSGIMLASALTSRTRSAVHVVGDPNDPDKNLPSGEYQLIVTSNTPFSSAPTFTSGFFYPKPTVGLGALPSNPIALTVPVPVQATVDDAFAAIATVTFFADTDNTGYDGSPIPGLTHLPFQTLGSTVTWNLQGLLPIPYYVYAVIDDGTNVPVKSAYTAAVTPMPPLSGQVTDQYDEAVSGLRVFLDANHDGRFDPSDPSTFTGSAGFYDFALPAPGPYTIGLVIPDGYVISPNSPNPNLVTKTWDGTDQLVVDFELDLKTAIRGTVYQDNNHDGTHDQGDPGLSGWTVYLDANTNGQLDAGELQAVTDSNGQYTFYNLASDTTYTVALDQQAAYFQTAPQPLPPGTHTATTDNSGFDLIDQQDFGVFPFASISGVVSGYAASGGQLDSNPTPLKDWTVRLLQDHAAINVGGGAAGDYQADQDFTGGTTASTTAAIDTSRVPDPAPPAVYQTNRFGTTFRYRLTGLTPNTPYAVRLHFAETFWDSAGARLFNLTINGDQVLTDYDIFAYSGGKNRAVAETFTVTADANGVFELVFTATKDNAQVNGIEISAVTATTTTDGNGHYSFGNLRPGAYAVEEVVQSGWRQIQPYQSDLQLQASDLYTFTQGPISSATADFDGNGKLDVAVLYGTPNQSGNYIILVFYDGDFSQGFGTAIQFSSSTPVVKMVANYVLGGVVPDLSVLNQGGDVMVTAYQGNHQFGPAYVVWSLTTTPFAANGISTAGTWTDLHALQGNAVVALFDTGTSFSPFILYYLNGQGQIVPNAWLLLPGTPGTLTVGDVNGEGADDYFFGNQNGSPTVYYWNYVGGFNPVTVDCLPAGETVVLGDINGDGLLDLGVFDHQSLFHYVLQNSSGTFTNCVATQLGPQGHGIGTALLRDVDGDLRPDLVFAAEGVGANALYVAINQGPTGNWFATAPQSVWTLTSAATGAVSVTPGDLNGDGLTDLVVTNQSSGDVDLFTNLSGVGPAPAEVTVNGNQLAGVNLVNAQVGQVSGVVFADVNRNGRRDPNEPGLAGVTVYVDRNRNGVYDPLIDTATTTNAVGGYVFTGLPAGTHQVRHVLPAERWPTTPAAAGFHEVPLAAGQSSTGHDFGSAPRLLAPFATPTVVPGGSLRLPVGLTTPVRNLTYSLEGAAPPGATINPVTGVVQWTPAVTQPPGTYPFTVRVRAPFEPTRTETRSFAVTVLERAAAAVPSPAEQFVRWLYRLALQREVDPGSLQYWLGRLQAGLPLTRVAAAVWNSTEHRALQVERLYQKYLHRPAGARARARWVRALRSGQTERQVALALVTSAEYWRSHRSARAFVAGLYADGLGRSAPPRALAKLVRLLHQGVSRRTVAEIILASP